MHLSLAAEIECTAKLREESRSFTSIACFSKNRIVLFDSVNSELILYDNDHGSFSYLQLTEPCWAIAYVDNNLLVATVGFKLQFFVEESEKLKLHGREFICQGKTKGIDFSNGLYAVVFEIEHTNKVVILDKKGKTIMQIKDLAINGSSIEIPNEIVLHGKGNLLYMCESKNHNIVCVSSKGKVLWITHRITCTPVCNPVFLGDFLLVLDVNNQLSLFSQSGNLMQTKTLPVDSSSSVPCSTTYDNNEKKMYVVNQQQVVVRAYTILCFKDAILS